MKFYVTSRQSYTYYALVISKTSGRFWDMDGRNVPFTNKDVYEDINKWIERTSYNELLRIN